jgi:hypothetical protein
MAIDENTINRLLNENRIAIHYPERPDGITGDSDSKSLNPNDYHRAAKGAIRALVELARDGGYVCAEYHGYTKVKIGKVSPETIIDLFEGQWAPENENAPRDAILKSIRLSEVKEIHPEDYATIWVGRPRQGTLQRWSNAGTVIEQLVEHGGLPISPKSLSPTQQEVLCSEFLRTEIAASMGLPLVNSLLLPVGRTMKDIDILGITSKGNRVFAQVTFSSFEAAGPKFQKLKKYNCDSGNHCIFFCSTSKMEIVNGIILFPLHQVFELFRNIPTGEIWIKKTLKPLD